MPFTRAYKIRFDDVDAAGLLYYPRYFDYCHRVLEDFIDERGPCAYAELIQDRRLGVPTVAVESAYRSPLRYGDTAVVSMEVNRIGTSSLILSYAVRREFDGEECFDARITTVLTDLDEEKSVPFSGELRDLFEELLAG